jgi:hypothetical protein
MEMREASPDVQPSPDNAIVVEQEPEAGAFPGAGSLSMSVGMTAVFESGGLIIDVVTPGETWTPYTPTAEQTDITIMAGRWTRLARVTLTFPNNGYQVNDWGALSREGNQLSVNALVEQREGPAEGGVTTISHDYDLGALNGYGDYVFSFNAGQQSVESTPFTIAECQWLPYSQIGDHLGIALITEGGTTRAKVTVVFPNGGYKIQDWGTVRLEGNTFVVDMEPQRSFGIATQAFVTLTHEYDLGVLPDGGYLFEIRAWDQLAMGKGFSASNTLRPVFRFWSPTHSQHFYTIDEVERDKLINQYSHFWTYEGVAYYAYPEATQPDTSAVYRFWSPITSSHFYTISEAERDSLIQNRPDAWIYEGVAFYAYAEEPEFIGIRRVQRFWSGQGHFFTADDREAAKIRSDEWSHVWTPEGIAWYTYGL